MEMSTACVLTAITGINKAADIGVLRSVEVELFVGPPIAKRSENARDPSGVRYHQKSPGTGQGQ